MNEPINGSVGVALEWDSVVRDTGDINEVIPEGDYNFRVRDVRRDWYAGSAKLPGCPMANMTLDLTDGDGRHWTKDTDIKLCEKLLKPVIVPFFRAIGQLDEGREAAMDWAAVPGATGRVRVSIHEYVDSAGNGRHGNELRYIPQEKEGTA